MIWKGLILLFIVSAESWNAKWFLPKGTVTSVVFQKKIVTSIVPSSCAVIDSTLPSCRNIRSLKIDPSPPTRIQLTALPAMVSSRSYDLEATETDRRGSWGGSWFWPQETVKQTIVLYQTVRQHNPDTVVSIAFKGCHPTRLPFNLSPCNNKTANASRKIQRDLHYTL